VINTLLNFSWGLTSIMRQNSSSFAVSLSRWAKLLGGFAFIGLSIAFMKQANLGLGPWDVLSDGLAGLTGMQLGTVSIIVGAMVLLLWIPMREKPGIALVPNILLIGAFTNMGLAMVQTASSALLRSVWLITGLILAGSLEVFVLIVGWMLGGAVGIGTVIFALTIGPAIQFMAGQAGQQLGERIDQPPLLLRECA
jgi:uncharacterized membrane protein YczE